MMSATDLTRLVPGFDFFQGLLKGGSAGMPGIGQWIAPTLEPAELQKRIDELRTVQFWLEQNSKLLGTTIQALEVQRMTLATLKGMNLPLANLSEALKLKTPAPSAEQAPVPSPPTPSAAAPSAAAEAKEVAAAKPGKSNGKTATATPAIDPMQWWGALTQQFTELATKAMKDGGVEVTRNLAGAAGKQAVEAAHTSIERAMAMSGKVAGLAAKTVAAAAPMAKLPAGATLAAKTAGKAPSKTAGRTAGKATSKGAGAARRKA
jgi:hypothetical protein